MSRSPSKELNWEEEANAVIQDVRQHVHQISISRLPSSRKKIFFNMMTLEMKEFCVELTRDGFSVVGEHFDSEAKRGKYPVFETPYSLLDSLSPAYRDSFGERLFEKLSQLQKERAQEEAAEANEIKEDNDEEEEEDEREKREKMKRKEEEERERRERKRREKEEKMKKKEEEAKKMWGSEEEDPKS